MKSGPHRIPCRIEVTVSEIIVATRTPWYQRSAFRAWVRDSLTTLSAVPIVDVAGWVTWKNALVVAGVMILKSLLTSLYQILYGPDSASYREVAPPVPTSPPDPMS